MHGFNQRAAARTAWLWGLLCLLALLPLPALAASPARELHDQPTVTVGIVLFDGVQVIDFAAPYEVFGTAGFGVATVSASGGPVTTAMGLKVTPDHSFADAPAFDLLVVPGGDVQDAMRDEALLAYIRRHPDTGKLMSVCTGAYILASAGLLDGGKATTFHGAFDRFERVFPQVNLVRDQRWVDTGRIVTSAGLSSGIDAALHLVSRFHGEVRARSVALYLEYPWDPQGGFVRGRMADRQAPRLAGVVWPEGTGFQPLYSVGDTATWDARFFVTSPATADQILTLIAADIASEGQWARQGDDYVWHRDIAGQRKRLAFGTEPAAGQGFVLWYQLK